MAKAKSTDRTITNTGKCLIDLGIDRDKGRIYPGGSLTVDKEKYDEIMKHPAVVGFFDEGKLTVTGVDSTPVRGEASSVQGQSENGEG